MWPTDIDFSMLFSTSAMDADDASQPHSGRGFRGGGGILAEFRPPRWRTKGRRAASIEAGKGPSASGMTPNPTTAA